MTLISSISGIRGTIGGKPGQALTPLDIVKFVSAYAQYMHTVSGEKRISVVVGRDARISGEMVTRLVRGTLMGCGIDVIDLGLATTPTVEMAVTAERAAGGIILTASHNPVQWNALKLLNNKGEFLSAAEGEKILTIAAQGQFSYSSVHELGKYRQNNDYTAYHIQKILELPYVDTLAIRKAGFRIVIDGINSVGGIAIPMLLKELGVKEVIQLNCKPDGLFAHNPEPLPEHLQEISYLVGEKHAHLGLVVDPDVDRLAIVCEDGSMFGEEYTLVSVADYLLSKKKGNTVSNLSSSRALKDITEKHGGKYYASAVGEVNVVEMMKKQHAVIGGEGNGGVILPDLHYGRDALVGTALFLTHLALSGKKASVLRLDYPVYVMSKNRIELPASVNPAEVLEKIKKHYHDLPVNDADGVRVDFEDGWVHMRKSNTEPILRIYSEGETEEKARKLAESAIKEIKKAAGI